MKDISKRKTLQARLNQYISEFTATLAKPDSKKLKKSIKKASKLIAKAILKNTEESEVELSLKDEHVQPSAGKTKKPRKKPTGKTAAKKRRTKKSLRKNTLPVSNDKKVRDKKVTAQRKPRATKSIEKTEEATSLKNNGSVSSPEKV